jgi:hypothetical protein
MNTIVIIVFLAELGMYAFGYLMGYHHGKSKR